MIDRATSLVLAIFLVLLAGCDAEPGEEPGGDEDPSRIVAEIIDPASVEYAPELGIDIARMQETPSGVRYRDEAEGEGEPVEPGHAVVVHYTGYLADGTMFESTRELGEPYRMEVGDEEVIRGWHEGVTGMRPGGVRTLVIPPHLAYGPVGVGDVVPPNAMLVFEVELLEAG